MTRLPLLRDDQVVPPEVVAAIRQRRGGQLLELDRLLLHSPAFAAGWNDFLGKVRTALQIEPIWRELAMCGVAVVNGAEYELTQHAPLFVRAGGSASSISCGILPALARSLKRIGWQYPFSQPSCPSSEYRYSIHSFAAFGCGA